MRVLIAGLRNKNIKNTNKNIDEIANIFLLILNKLKKRKTKKIKKVNSAVLSPEYKIIIELKKIKNNNI